MRKRNRRIYQKPGEYVPHIYGEHEVGGTGYLYLSKVPFEQIGFRTDLGTTPYPEFTKGFLYSVPLVLLLWPAFLIGVNTLTKKGEEEIERKRRKIMNETAATPEIKNVKDFWTFIRGELKPKGKIFTTFNVISFPIIVLGAALILFRLVKGLGAVTNLSQEFPWGIWIGFDVMVGVAFAGGAYILTFVVYILRSEKYHPIARATVLNGFLAYVFYAGAIFLDLGRWWNIIEPHFWE